MTASSKRDPAPPGGGTKLGTILDRLDGVDRQAELAEVWRSVARGFSDAGAGTCTIFVRDGDVLRLAADWPQGAADAHYRSTAGGSGSLADFTIPLTGADNPYVEVLTSQAPKLLSGPEEVAELLVRAYQLQPSSRRAVAATLAGQAGAVIPLAAPGSCSLAVVSLAYPSGLTEADRHIFSLLAGSAARLLGERRSAPCREAVPAELIRSERLAALREMSSAVGHEIRNALGVIKNSSAMLKKHIAAGATPQLLQDMIAEELIRIGHILDSLRVWASPMANKGQEVDPGEAIKRAISFASDLPPSEEQNISYHCEEELDLIAADPNLVLHLLLNLLLNARQATEHGGSVQISAKNQVLDGRRHVRFTVRDDGRGIAKSMLAHIYEPFMSKSRGIGLGMAIVKRVVEVHDGRITIESQEGSGTTVTVDLPAAPGDS